MENAFEVKMCNATDMNQKWLWGFTNITAGEN
jgi:hypothetical protein